jgi:4-diphosphocytidyl-2C-methyl-D-erythritol kinase
MVQRFLKYTVAVTDEQQTSYINIARDLSAINRQLFRQARTYKIKSITLVDDDDEKYVQFGFAPNTWAMKNSVRRAFKRWNEMNNQVLDDQPSLKARWNDFKPYLSVGHFNAVSGSGSGVGTLESVEDIGGNKLQYGE